MKIKSYYEPMHKQITDNKALSELEELKVECVCGRKVIMPVYIDSVICKHCGNKIQNDSKLYFMYKMRKELNK